ncbi:MAG TPA: hypothetical protein GX707_16065 [Epulopiscium sp.]|nr:hypothetical protein [Candidatus Epulonipiscium sp.]
MMILIGVIGLVLYYGFQDTGNGSNVHRNDPNEMLKERFVNGEINEQTYLQMKETLKR